MPFTAFLFEGARRIEIFDDDNGLQIMQKFVQELVRT